MQRLLNVFNAYSINSFARLRLVYFFGEWKSLQQFTNSKTPWSETKSFLVAIHWVGEFEEINENTPPELQVVLQCKSRQPVLVPRRFSQTAPRHMSAFSGVATLMYVQETLRALNLYRTW